MSSPGFNPSDGKFGPSTVGKTNNEWFKCVLSVFGLNRHQFPPIKTAGEPSEWVLRLPIGGFFYRSANSCCNCMTECPILSL